MATIYDIIQGINQAAANAYDGSHDERYSSDGEARKVGLKREEGDPIIDSRIMDGFKVKFHGDKLVVLYHSEFPIKEVHNSGFVNDVESIFSDITKFLRKEYKSVTGNSLTLTSQGDAQVLLQNMSNIRTWCQANKTYKIGGLNEVEPVSAGTPKDRLDKAIEKFLSIGKDKYPGAKKPTNITRKND
tara:strand:- start:120 stop:680 length:561 start_codon:yes stop_codon:yes gene_type:complete